MSFPTFLLHTVTPHISRHLLPWNPGSTEVTKEVRCNSSRNGDLDALLQAINALPDAASLFVDATGISMQSLE
jgi:hypothetical protein